MKRKFILLVICSIFAIMTSLACVIDLVGITCLKEKLVFSNWLILPPLSLSLLFGAAAWLIKRSIEKDPRKKDYKFAPRDGYQIILLCWVLVPLLGAIPYLPVFHWNAIDAWFESVSGFTTTGATLFTVQKGMVEDAVDYADVKQVMLLWRAMTQWIGGLGLLLFVVLLAPMMSDSGGALFGMEMTGIKSRNDRISTRFKESVLWCLGIYIGLTIAEIFCLKYAGMKDFDSVCYSLATLSTGGFETGPLKLEHGYPDAKFPLLDWILILFMYLGGCNFLLHYRLIRNGKFQYHKNSEWRFFTWTILISSAILCCYLLLREDKFHHQWLDAIRESLFMCVSLGTSTGFASNDYRLWGGITPIVMCVLMCVCGCGGSTSGGMKCERVMLSWKYILSEVKHCLYPHYEADIRIDGQSCSDAVLKKTIGFCLLYFFIIIIFAALIALCETGTKNDLSLETTLTTSISCLSNVGIGFGRIGPYGDFSTFRPLTKILLTIEMIIGRLELYTILVLFLPSCWKRTKEQ